MTMRLWLVPALLLSTTLCHGEIVVQDHSGRTLRLDRPATRIVSLAPHITEMLYAVGAGERIVALHSSEGHGPMWADPTRTQHVLGRKPAFSALSAENPCFPHSCR